MVQYFVLLWVLLFVWVSIPLGKVEIGPTALFSDKQWLWPEIDTSIQRDLANEPKSNPRDSSRVIVLPIFSVQSDEKPVCDSCDRYSPAVIEFLLPNWHRETLQGWTPSSIEVLRSGDPLLQGDSTWFDSNSSPVHWPWQEWLAAPLHNAVIRNRDQWVADSVIQKLSSLGGKLAATHLLVFDSVQVRLRPWSRGSHHGSYRFSYRLILWNVARSQPEWATQIQMRGPFWSDLDAPWDTPLKAAFEGWKNQIPQIWRRTQNEEPH